MTLEVIWGNGSPYAWRVLLALEVKGLSDLRIATLPGYERTSPPHWRETAEEAVVR